MLIWAIYLLPNWKRLQQKLCRLFLKSRLEARMAFFEVKSEKGNHAIFQRWMDMSETMDEMKDCFFSCLQKLGQYADEPIRGVVQKMLNMIEPPCVTTLRLFQTGVTFSPSILMARFLQQYLTNHTVKTMVENFIARTANALFEQALSQKEVPTERENSRLNGQLAWEYSQGTYLEQELWIRFCQSWPE